MNDKLKHRVISHDSHISPYKSYKMPDHNSYTIKKTNSLISEGQSHMRFTIKMGAYSHNKQITSSKPKEMNMPYEKQQPLLEQTKLRLLQKKLSEHKLAEIGNSLSKNQIVNHNLTNALIENGEIEAQSIKIEKNKKSKDKKHSIYFTKGNNHQLLKQIFVDKYGFKEAFSRDSASICWLQSSNQKQSIKRSRNIHEDHLPQIAKRRSEHGSVIYNYLQGQSQLTNKQRMFKNMKNNFPEAIGKYIPRSFIIDFRKNQSEIHENLHQFISYYFKKTHNKKPRTKNLVIRNYFVDITLSDKELNKIITSIPNTSDTTTTNHQETNNQYHPDSNPHQSLWILKPTYLNRGRGIHLFSTLKQLSKLLSQSSFEISVKMYSENMKPKTYIIQQYIQRPLLINGYKFDMRFWALIQVVKVNGKKILKAYLFKHGYLRLASIKYDINSVEQLSLQGENQKQDSQSKQVPKQQKIGIKKQKKDYINNRFIHLTNNAVQKQAKQYGKFCQGNQLSLQQMITHFQQRDKNASLTLNSLMQNIEKIVKQSILSVKQELISANSNKTFQLLGYDFLLDHSYNLWFIEVNCNPCLQESSELVGNLLRKMLEGLVKIISLQQDKGPDNSEGWIELF